MKSVMAGSHSFAQVPKAEIQRSSFNRSHGLKSTFSSGILVPIYFDEALPGDSFNLRLTAFARMATPIKPIMDNMYMDTFFFSVPLRLIWDNFYKFMGEQVNPGDSTDFLVPQITGPSTPGITSNSLSDYLGLPVGVSDLKFNALHHRAYLEIWNTWFRDQNLQPTIVFPKGDGPDSNLNYSIQRRNKAHDYFTSALPWPQKNNGNPVTIPLGGNAPVRYVAGLGAGTPNKVRAAGTDAVLPSVTLGTDAGGNLIQTGVGTAAYLDPNNRWIADLSAATAATINSLRQAFQLQRLFERDARGGSRYIEVVQAHFGVTSPDLRALRPQYLGGGRTPVNINPVAQTQSSNVGVTPQGNMSGYGTVSAVGHGFTHSFTEHCVVLGLACVTADLTYQQGLDRMYSRRTRYDFYWPALSHLGEEPIYNREIYCKNDANDALVFGYQEKDASYRYKASKITGSMRSNVVTPATTLDVWHLSQNFASLPTLNSGFIQENPPLDRVVAVPSEPHFIYDSYIQLTCARPMPVYGVPGMIDHF